MRKLLTLGILILLLSCQEVKKQPEKFTVTFNKNIETYFLAEILSINHIKTYKQWEEYKLKTCKSYQPIVDKALTAFDNLTQNKIAIETAKLHDTLISFGYGNDAMMEVLLEQPEFDLLQRPSDFKFSQTHLKGNKKKILENIISNYLQVLYNFYHTENIDDFFKKNTYFYNGAIHEVQTHIPKGFTDAIEKYYGDSREKYVVLVSPMMIWPIENNEGRGIGPTVQKDGKKNVYEIMSPYVQIPINSTKKKYDQFGFDYQPRARVLTIHEFGHSFVNSELENYHKQIDNSSRLFTKKLEKKMNSKGIQTWNVYVIESLVRLGEIRIAEIQKDKERADYLRNYHTNLEHFIFLPQLEEKIIEFENDRKKYPMWKDFIPELLNVFENGTPEFINEKLK
ncbi:DUF4932 domain-containing protein [Wenyingzhuangia sp. chi5]|uniref:DUF4932 domain-containing protein n=1 Tax=Wenyingzhuangia gilva TaxID=3057677 RepID=A0ABT8VVL4_9FLAO|nr:DUF4932 domain-containing protein [Wenyingzhuangia sp. chi5]MDO3695972.1 DUF4932 domain-containing protein [Wenyingzhuangia sp. chi5]